MSNSFPTPPPALADEVTVVAGQPIGEGAITAMSQTANYLWHYGGTSNVVSQAWDEGQLVQKGTTYAAMLRYKIPPASSDHYTLKIYAIAKGSGYIRADLLTSGGNYNSEVGSTGAGPHLVAFDVTVTTMVDDADFDLIISVKHTADATSRHEISMIMARWEPLASPVSPGARSQIDREFIPFGINRVGNDYPLSSRWGRHMLNNIETLRRRPQMWLSWSGVEGLQAAPTSSSDPAPANHLGVGDIGVMGALVHIPEEAVLTGSFDVVLWAYVSGLSGGTTVSLSVLGHVVTFSANGWQSASLTVEVGADREASDVFHLNIYRVELDANATNQSELETYLGVTEQIKSLCVWGI